MIELLEFCRKHLHQLVTRLYNKRKTSIFPYMYLPSAPAHEMYLSRLVRYAAAGFFIPRIFDRGKLFTNKLALQGYRPAKLI